MVEIAYLGHAAFKVVSHPTVLIFDPFDPQKVTGLKWKPQVADVVCLTHEHDDHAYLAGIQGRTRDLPTGLNPTEQASKAGREPFIINGPGEYEVAGLQITGLPAFHDKQKGSARGPVTLYKVVADGVILGHLGDLGHLLDETQMKALEDVDLLMVPCGGVYTLDSSEAAAVVDQIEPYLVIPMHYGVPGSVMANEWKLEPVENFLRAMKTERTEPVDRLRLKSRADLPEGTQVVVMESPR